MSNHDHIRSCAVETPCLKQRDCAQELEKCQRVIEAAEIACKNYLSDIARQDEEIESLKRSLRIETKKLASFESFFLTRVARRICMLGKRATAAVKKRRK